MATTVFDYMQKIDKVIEALPNETERIILSNSEKILDLNRDAQLYEKGITSEGNLLFPPYANITRQIKANKLQPINRVTLFDTGDFYRGFDIRINYPIFSIYSTDQKSSDLMDKYGSDIFGLTVENQRKVNYEILKPEIDAFIKKNL